MRFGSVIFNFFDSEVMRGRYRLFYDRLIFRERGYLLYDRDFLRGRRKGNKYINYLCVYII